MTRDMINKVYDVNVISLERAKKRRNIFEQQNNHMIDRFTYFNAIDAHECWDTIQHARIVNRSFEHGWSKGSIGCGLSHTYLWQQCAQSTKPKIIIEDDALISKNFEKITAAIFRDSFFEKLDICMLGCNLDSALITVIEGGLRAVTLFTPEYPDPTVIRQIIDSSEARSIRKLHATFGLAGYILTPKGAKKLLSLIKKFENIPSQIGRGIPSLNVWSLDGMMNSSYCKLNSFITIPPIIVGTNDQSTSTTRQDFDVITG